jgi:hypothetical protein
MEITMKERKELLKRIEEIRQSRLIVYFTSDRSGPLAARIAPDAVRPLYDHLLSMDKVKRLDLFLYSVGGDVSVPWRIVSMFREFCEEFSVLLPYKAYSAATLLSLGADKIVMGRKAELGPIDPYLERTPLEMISVEDVKSYISFIKEKVNIHDQSALAEIVSLLANNVDPKTLGGIYRADSHIKLVARKLLTSRKEKMEEGKVGTIVETLTEKIYSHGHGISRSEAMEMGLPIEKPSTELEEALWNLYLQYEDMLKLCEPLDPELILGEKEETIESLSLAIIESREKLHVFDIKVEFKRRRQIPQNLQINLNLVLNLPPNIKPEDIPEEARKSIEQLLNELSTKIKPIVEQEIRRQSPEIDIVIKPFGGMWREIKEEVI